MVVEAYSGILSPGIGKIVVSNESSVTICTYVIFTLSINLYTIVHSNCPMFKV